MRKEPLSFSNKSNSVIYLISLADKNRTPALCIIPLVKVTSSLVKNYFTLVINISILVRKIEVPL